MVEYKRELSKRQAVCSRKGGGSMTLTELILLITLLVNIIALFMNKQ